MDKKGGGEFWPLFFPSQNSPLLKWSLLAPPFPSLSLPLTHTYTYSIHWPPSTPWLPCIAYLTSLSLYLSSASMLTHVCANVTSIFHWQPLPVFRSPLLFLNICRTHQLLWCSRVARRKNDKLRYLLQMLTLENIELLWYTDVAYTDARYLMHTLTKSLYMDKIIKMWQHVHYFSATILPLSQMDFIVHYYKCRKHLRDTTTTF